MRRKLEKRWVQHRDLIDIMKLMVLAASPKRPWACSCTRSETLGSGPIIYTLNVFGQWIELPTSSLHLRNEISPRSLRTP
jgi:hypothetical protein